MSDVRAMLAETVRRLFDDGVTPALVADVERGAWPAALWRTVEAHGLVVPHLPETVGGAGGTWEEAVVVAAATGRHAVPLPVVETMLGAWLLAAAGLEVSAGPLAVAPALVPAARHGDGRLSADVARVPWARRATALVLPLADESAVACARAFTVTREGESLAREPRDDVRVDGPVQVGSRPVPPDALRAAGALLRAAQIAGALDAILARSVRHANERVQFGKPIGRQQAVQQELARLAGMAAETGMAAAVAARAAAVGGITEATFEIAAAKTVAGDAADAGPRIAHQVHGAIGFTYEHALHFFTRRLWTWRGEFGDAEEWARVLGRCAVAAGPERLWSLVTAH